VAGTAAALDHDHTAMIALVKKALWFSIVLFGWTSVGLAQSTFLEVGSTPYDRQMSRVQPILTAPSGYTVHRISFALVNEWMIELRAMPYRYSREWRTPSEVEAARAGDCKGKALALYDRMQLNGVTNVRFVIGKRRITDSVTHAWLELETEMGTLLLDPTFNWTATIKASDTRSYIAFYGYEKARKYWAANSLLANRTLGTRSPVAPSQGAITRPVRSFSKLRSNPWFVDEGPISPRSFLNRTAL
jgi:predicted transglutaminase-like cysteine proteinase